MNNKPQFIRIAQIRKTCRPNPTQNNTDLRTKSTGTPQNTDQNPDEKLY